MSYPLKVQLVGLAIVAVVAVILLWLFWRRSPDEAINRLLEELD